MRYGWLERFIYASIVEVRDFGIEWLWTYDNERPNRASAESPRRSRSPWPPGFDVRRHRKATGSEIANQRKIVEHRVPIEELALFERIRELLATDRYTVSESLTIPASPAQRRPMPDFLNETPVGPYLLGSGTDSEVLWNHQAIALNLIDQRKNVVVATPTASGKSLIFRSAVFDRVAREPEARTLVLYPLKALGADQMKDWKAMATDLGFSDEIVGRIDGSVSFTQRDEILKNSRILIVTPDVVHAWMMSRLSMPVIKSFVKNLEYIVMDEAHTFEGVFGSNVAYLLRRLFSARRILSNSGVSTDDVQIIAATATISNPREHLNKLTGLKFEAVDESQDGSPHAERQVAHIVCPKGEGIKVARNIQTHLLNKAQDGGFITFVDSRKGVERLARSSQGEDADSVGDRAVMPYRSGYNVQDREAIERRLQSGSLRGVVSTSALELGIDLPHLVIGMNVGVPGTRKAYRQRLGRIGRRSSGCFLVVAPHDAFRGFGTSFSEYHEMSVEPSYLYLDNRFMQFAHARCLADELEAIGASNAFPADGQWPKGFENIYKMAKPGGTLPPEFDAIAQLGGDSPQRSYPLRNVGELNFNIARTESSEPFGEVNESQALRECYPGAAYLHMGQNYEVLSWHTNVFAPFIKVRPDRPDRTTKPHIRTWVNTGFMASDVLDGHILVGTDVYLAECQMQITEKVEGFVDQNTDVYHDYQELRKRKPNMRPRQRNFRTSGIVLSIDQEWFKQSGVKQRISDWLVDIFAREYSILRQDIGSAATNISVRTNTGGGISGHCIAIFDQTYGSLRLTERLFCDFGRILSRLRVSAEAAAPDERWMYTAFSDHLESIYAGLTAQSSIDESEEDGTPPPGVIQVFSRGSVVYCREKGNIGTDVTIVQPTWWENKLMYQVEVPSRDVDRSRIKRWVAEHALEPSADASAWSYEWWDGRTEEYVESDERSD